MVSSHSLNKYLLSTHHKPGTILEVGIRVLNKNYRLIVFMELTLGGRMRGYDKGVNK